MLSLGVADLLDGDWEPECVSCGVPYAIIPLRNRDAVRRAQLAPDVWKRLLAGAPGEMVFVFAREAEEPGHDVRARMFALGVGIAGGPRHRLRGCSARRLPGDARCPSRRDAAMGGGAGVRDGAAVRAGDRGGQGRRAIVRAVRVGGASVLMMEGTLTLP